MDYKQLGAYGILLNDDKILLIKKNSGPYHGKLDLQGGTIEVGERPIEALKREYKEEVGIDVIECELFDVDSVYFKWNYNNELINVHHVGIFYKITKYNGEIKKENVIDEINDDSLGAEFYELNKLNEKDLSKIAWLEVRKIIYSKDVNN